MLSKSPGRQVPAWSIVGLPVRGLSGVSRCCSLDRGGPGTLAPGDWQPVCPVPRAGS